MRLDGRSLLTGIVSTPHSSLEFVKAPSLFKRVLLDESSPWDSAKADDNLRVALPDFDYEGNNSFVLRGLAPDEGVFEVALTPDGLVEEEVFFLFKVNIGRRQVSSHAKIDMVWETGQSNSYRMLPFRAGMPFFLRLVLCPDGFGVYVNGNHLCDMSNVHRDKTGRQLPKGQKLFAVLRKSGDYGEACSLRALGMWWGHSRHSVSVERVPTKRKRDEPDDGPSATIAKLSNLPATMSLTRLMELASKYGSVVDVDEPVGGICRVTFSDPGAVTALITAVNGTTLDGQQVVVTSAGSKTMRHTGGAGGAGDRVPPS